ncbi:MAG: hypothetical protein H7259_04425 [Cytophagales bacterium]|nr:hypothetical protein [Cytophaga sp.]
MPFFYINYGILIPCLLKKETKKFFIFTVLWSSAFIWAYSTWTIYQRSILYGEALRTPEYIETLNNLISIWLMSTGFCLFEFWIKNREKNQKLSLDRKNHLLKSEQNIMLNHLLSDYLDTLEKRVVEELPEKILLVSDFFKYILYNRDVPVTLKTERSYIKIYEELKNSNGECVNIRYGILEEDVLIGAAQILSIINRLVTILQSSQIVEIVIESGSDDDNVRVCVDISEHPAQKEIILKEFMHSKIERTTGIERCVISVDGHFVN